MDLASRIVYTALADSLRSALPESRTPESAEAFYSLGQPYQDPDRNPEGPERYLVEFDIASCYEFIDHDILWDELVSVTNEVDNTGLIRTLLGKMFPTGRGLPQLTSASDRLADAYLSILERHLVRSYPELARYVDDFRLVATGWLEATTSIEEAAEAAREIGLILSTEKTNIIKMETMADREQKRANFLSEMTSRAKGEVGSIVDFVMFEYHPTPDAEETEAKLIELRIMTNIVTEWVQKKGEGVPFHSQFLPFALRVLGKDAESNRISDDELREIVFWAPIRLEAVADYLSTRAKHGEISQTWETLIELVRMNRQSPWAKIWLLNLSKDLSAVTPPAEYLDWVEKQLSDRHEIVRAEAAWVLAGARVPSVRELSNVYTRASITRTGVAAACGRAQLSGREGLVKAIKKDRHLVQLAYAWGETHR